MRIFGVEIRRVRAQSASLVPSNNGWFGVVRESFPGAFQRHITIDSGRSVLAFSAVFSCVTGIASDIAKLCIDLVEEDDGILTEVVSTSPYWPVLRKPNHYQTRIKFVEQWIVSKLLHGNSYALKQRDARGIVTALYILDPQSVKPLVTEDGGVYYELSADHLSGLLKTVTIPASEIIHDMMVSLWHQLVGVSPIFACAMSATMGNRIQRNSTTHFDNMSRPGGMLVAPGIISLEDAQKMKEMWEANYSGANSGRTAVLGNGLKYEPIGSIPPEQSQLIEQLRWTVEDVARCFRYPLFKLGGPVPVNGTIDALTQAYYADCLQSLIESFELCLDEGLELGKSNPPYYTMFNLDGLLRMDQAAQMAALSESVKGSIRTPNEARQKLNLKPVRGGDDPLAQQQNYSLAAIAKRDALPDPFATASTTPEPARRRQHDDDDDDAANDEHMDTKEAEALLDYIAKGLACEM